MVLLLKRHDKKKRSDSSYRNFKEGDEIIKEVVTEIKIEGEVNIKKKLVEEEQIKAIKIKEEEKHEENKNDLVLNPIEPIAQRQGNFMLHNYKWSKYIYYLYYNIQSQRQYVECKFIVVVLLP